jgi:hypothetical protein
MPCIRSVEAGRYPGRYEIIDNTQFPGSDIEPTFQYVQSHVEGEYGVAIIGHILSVEGNGGS